jgi:hypothetical protein
MDRFVSLVFTGRAYFRRLDLLQDKFEGALSVIGHAANVSAIIREATEHGLAAEGLDQYELAYLTAGSEDAWVRASTYTNCWTRNPYECSAMWNYFGQNGVAIGSTIGRVRDAFLGGAPLDKPDPMFIGRVEYIDHETDEMDWNLPFLFKNQMFSWEREVRIGTFHYPREGSAAGFNENHEKGISLRVDLDTLIEQVVVAPGSSEDFRFQVENLLEQYGVLGKPVNYSAADRTPEYRRIHEFNQQRLRDLGYRFPIHKRDSESA